MQDALGSEEGPTSAPSPVSEANALAAAKEMHASSAGLKALCTFIAAEGLEDCRKCCGGHGVLLGESACIYALRNK